MRHAWIAVLLVLSFLAGCYHSTGVEAPISIISEVDETNETDFIGDSPKTMAARGDYYISNNNFDVIVDGSILGEREQNFLAPTGGSIIDISNITVNNLLQRTSFNNDNLNQIFQVVNHNQGTPIAYTSIRIDTLSDQRSSIKMIGQVMDRDGSLRAAGMSVDPSTDLVNGLTVETEYSIEKNDDYMVMTTVLRNDGTSPAPIHTIGDYVFMGGNSLRPFLPAPGYGYCPENGSTAPVYVPYVTLEEHFAPYMVIAMYAPDDGVLECTFDSSNVDYRRSGGRFVTVSKPSHLTDTLEPGGAITFIRYLEPSLSQNTYTAAAAAITSLRDEPDHSRNLYEETGSISGVVNNNPVDENMIVTAEQVVPGSYFNGDQIVSSPVPVPYAAERLTESGGFNFLLPPGRYQIRVFGNDVENYVQTTFTKIVDLGDPDVSGDEVTEETPIDLYANRSITVGEIGLNTEQFGAAHVTITEDGEVASGRVTVLSNTGDNMVFGDGEGGEEGVYNHQFLYYGDREFNLRQGDFTMLVSHGPLYDVVESPISVTLVEEEDDEGNVSESITVDPESNDVEINRVVDPGSYVSVDPVVRTYASYNCSVTDLSRLMTALSEDLDVMILSDFNKIKPERDMYAALEKRYENETDEGISLNPDDVHILQGATIKNFVPDDLLDQGFGEYAVFPLVSELGERGFGVGQTGYRRYATVLDNLRNRTDQTLYSILLNPRGTDRMPNGILSGLLNSLGEPVPADFSNPYFQRTSELGTGSTNAEFNMIEVLSGNQYDEYLMVRQDWFAGLRDGFVRWAVGGSGFAANGPQFVGSPRTWVHQPDASVFDEPTLYQAMAAGQSFVSTGPFLTVTADGELPGSTVSATSGQLALNINIQAPSWIPVEEVRVIVDGEIVYRESLADQTGTTRYSGTLTVDLPETDSFVLVECGVSPENMAAGIYPGGIFAQVYPGVQPLAFTNPFLVDRDGDGSWQ